MDYKKYIREVPDFPKKGILFYDITTLLKDALAFSSLIDDMVSCLKSLDFSAIVGIESRGFIFGGILAKLLNKSFVPIRKAGKLPYKKISVSYGLEYGRATIEIHEDALSSGDRVVIVDDLLATGGTTKAAIDLVKRLGADVEALLYAIELEFLQGRELLNKYVDDDNIISIIKY